MDMVLGLNSQTLQLSTSDEATTWSSAPVVAVPVPLRNLLKSCLNSFAALHPLCALNSFFIFFFLITEGLMN